VCSVDGCDRDIYVKSRQICKLHYNRLPEQAEKRRARERERYATDPSYRSGKKSKASRYYERNAEKVKAYQRTYGPTYEKSPSRIAYKKKYLAENLPEYARRRATRRARELNADVRLVEDKDKAAILRHYRGCCAYCGEPLSGRMEWDHVIPLAKGGRHSIGNLVPTCVPCNRSKSHKILAEWRYRRALDATLLSAAV
jgi:5-methylcytosine-specific restriction endonuclease McrA